MASLAAKYAAKKMLSKEMDKYKSKPADNDLVSARFTLTYPPNVCIPLHPCGRLIGMPQDPFYQMIPHPKKPGKMKKVKRQIPAYIPPREAEILAYARKRAYRLDFALFSLFGIRFGWSSVIALIPAIGDALDAAFALLLIRKMATVPCGLPKSILLYMGINIFIDFVVGLVPFVGDLADAYVKCNSKNVRLLEKHLDKVFKPEEIRQKEKAMDPKARPRPAIVYEDFSDEEEEERRNNGSFERPSGNVQEPPPAYSGRGQRIPDEEMGRR